MAVSGLAANWMWAENQTGNKDVWAVYNFSPSTVYAEGVLQTVNHGDQQNSFVADCNIDDVDTPDQGVKVGPFFNYYGYLKGVSFHLGVNGCYARSTWHVYFYG